MQQALLLVKLLGCGYLLPEAVLLFAKAYCKIAANLTVSYIAGFLGGLKWASATRRLLLELSKLSWVGSIRKLMIHVPHDICTEAVMFSYM